MSAVALHQQGKLAEAKAVYESLLQSHPKHADTLHLLGVVHAQLGDFHGAVKLIEQAIIITPTHATYYYDLGNAQLALMQYESAIHSYEHATRLNPKYLDAQLNLAMVLQAVGHLEAAFQSFSAVIEIEPKHLHAMYQRAMTAYFLGKYPLALADFDEILAMSPDHIDATYNRANTLIAMHRFREAIDGYRRTIALNPSHAEAHNNLGCALQEILLFDQAIIAHEATIRINARVVSAYFNLANALARLGRLEEAVFQYEQAIKIDKEYDFLFGACVYLKMKICHWSDFDENVQALKKLVEQGKKTVSAFALLALVDEPALQRKASEIWLASKYPSNTALGAIQKVRKDGRIRLGYFSADLQDHATAWLMAELFERHDRERFELFAFSFGPDKQDAMRQRVVAAFDHFFDVRDKSDQEVAQLARSWGIDIAIDLKGFTQDARTGIFAYRAAPIQVNYLGYPGTMGAPYIDYLIADPVLIPEASRQHYAEKIVYLPDSYQVNDRHRKISDRVFSKADVGLPEQGFVFCCFNNNYKITPEVFDSWMRILKAVPKSVLWLFEDNATAATNLRKEAQQRGVDADRLVFAQRMELSEHLARHRLADLFLDTVPCNAHTTASDDLWAGLPVLTRVGESFASRVAASLLTAIQLPELITETVEHYESLAIQLATHPEQLRAIQAKLEHNRLTTPLFDTERYTRNLESAFMQMVDR
jgi:tetratricopeptide (TPR) repeat protein